MANDFDLDSIKKLKIETLKELEYYTILKKISSYCISVQGKEIIEALEPYDDPAQLQQEHDLIEEMSELITLDDHLPLEGLTDIRNTLQKTLIESAVLNTTDILKVHDNIRVSRLIKSYFTSRNEKYPILFEFSQRLHENRFLEKHIEDAIDDTGEVKDTATKELQRIRQEIHEKSNRLRARLRKILRRTIEEDLVQEDFVTMREGRFVLPIKAEHKRTLPGIIHGVSQTGATVFLEPSEIIDMNNELSLLHNEEQREVYKILTNLTAEIGSDAQLFMSSMEIVAHIDSLRARARYALDFGGIKPIILEEKRVYLRAIKHPILVQNKGRDKVIPLNIEFTMDKRGHLISGPNAGGKTVALKSIGLNIIMALSGIYPIGECHTGYYDVYSSIGDHQSVENDLSTFSSQMLQMKRILDACDNKSLILVDEIGSGTDPQEGAALAAGILDSFIEINLFFVATTHQSSLKTYALNRPEIENASLEFDEKNLKPTYHFLSGVPGNSYAFVLAKDIGMSDLVLKRAKNYLGKKESELEESIALLSHYRSEAVKIRAEAEKDRRSFEKLKKEYETKLNEIKAKRREFVDKAKEDALKIVENANAMIENTIREVREEKRSISEIKKDYEAEKNKIRQEVKDIEEKAPKELQEKKGLEQFDIGDNVAIAETNAIGVIIDMDKKAETALVESNGFKFRLPLKQLTKSKKKKDESKRDYSDYIKYDASSRIDIRGERIEEAIIMVEDFIGNAVLANLDYVTIIHGKGTGALRSAIHEFLENHQSVDTFRLGELVEGGAGVTIVTLYK